MKRRGPRLCPEWAKIHGVAICAALAFASPGSLGAEEQPVASIPVAEVKAGQRGWGLSVFSGSQPERFEVEVLGVLENQSPDTSYILARLSGKNLAQTGVAAGMSGSPVFIDGRLAGAVAFGWPFAQEAIAGITPIDAMRGLDRIPSAPAGTPVSVGRFEPSPSVTEQIRQIVSGRPSADRLEQALSGLRPRAGPTGAVGLLWAASGFGETTQGLLQGGLGMVAPLGAAGAASSSGASSIGDVLLPPGSAVAGVLVDGDMRLAVTGTVTDRTGDSVLAFGHAFLGSGPASLPMAPAEVLAVVPSVYSSFKVASFGAPVGAFDQDRVLGVRGRIGLRAETVPLSVRLRGHEFGLRLAPAPQLLPMLVAISTLGAIERAGYVNGSQQIDLDTRLRLRSHGELRLRQSFDGPRAALDSAVYLLSVASFLIQNRLEEVAIENVGVEIAQSDAPQTAALVGAHADRTLVRPGDRVVLSLDLVAYRGERFRHSLEIALPQDLPTGRYSLIVGDGSSIDGARLAIEGAPPESLDQALDILRSLHSRRDLVVLGVYGGKGLAVAGRAMPRLPASVRSLWGAAASGSATFLRQAVAQEEVEPFRVPLDGAVRIDLEVRRRAPLPSGIEEGGSGPGKKAPAPPLAAPPPATKPEPTPPPPAPPPPPPAPPPPPPDQGREEF